MSQVGLGRSPSPGSALLVQEATTWRGGMARLLDLVSSKEGRDADLLTYKYEKHNLLKTSALNLWG